MWRCHGVGRSAREVGAAAVEFAIILPVLLLIVAGIIDFGRAFFTQVTLTNAAREGARAAVIRVDAGVVEARTRAALGPLDTGAVTVGAGSCPASGGGPVTVDVTSTFDWLILEPMANLFGAGSVLPASLSSEATMECGG